MTQAALGTAPYRNSNLFSGYYLDERVDGLDAWDCDEEARAAFEELRDLWRGEQSLVGGYNEDALLESWIDAVLGTLGFDTIQATPLPDTRGFVDRVLFDSAEDRRTAMTTNQDGVVSGTFETASALLEAKQWDAAFDESLSDQRQYRDASHQVKYYLEQTPDSLRWGVLTNGRKWRLYGIRDYETQTYYEVDLPELLESGSLEAFKYFYVFFRSAAVRELSGTSFLETVWNESETAAQEVGEDLQDNAFTALRVLGEGFVESNDLTIGDDEDAIRARALKEHTQVLLYRLLFVLYAESRGLISPDGQSRRAEYHEHFSLDELRREIHEEVQSGKQFDEYSTDSTSMWGRLEDLFRLVDAGEEALGIPPYNGGLFDRDEHAFLADHEVSNRYVAEVVYRLGTTRGEDGDGFVLADYADLDTRHLGTIYEGLLEHEFRIAPAEYAAVNAEGGQVWNPATEVNAADAVETVDEGELYVVNDDGERKATGAYYTPDDVVTYIVEETIDPLIDEIDEELAARGIESGTEEYVFRFADEVLDLTVLDPAMGSGHFLTKATGYLAARVMVRAREVESTAGVLDEQDIRRRVSRECIYGVDSNDMAVELAKLSMWLETLAEEKPLAFLDHHLKTGNSLVGSDITEVLSTDDADETGGQMTLFEAVAHARQQTLEHVMALMSDLLAIDNEEYADIQSMEELYAEIRDDPLYGRLFEVANVHTAEQFGLDVPEGVYEEMAGAIESEAEWSDVRERDWFRSAQAMAAAENFFHWELEYPEVFFGDDGEKRTDAGFDAVVGNPPWVATAGRATISANMDTTVREYLSARYDTAQQQFDLYVAFYEKFVSLSRAGGTGIVVPDAMLTREQNVHIRTYVLNTTALRRIVHVGTAFKNVENGAVVLVTGTAATAVDCGSIGDSDNLQSVAYDQIPQGVFAEQPQSRFLLYLDSQTRSVLEKMDSQPTIGSRIRISRGEEIGKTAEFLSAEQTDEQTDPILPGSAVIEYGFDTDEIRYISPDRIEKAPQNYQSPKLVCRQTTHKPVAAIDTDSRATIKSVYNIQIESERDTIHTVEAVLNSSLLEFYHDRTYAAYRSVFPQINQSTYQSYPIPIADEPRLADLVKERSETTEERHALSTDLSAYLGRYDFGDSLDEIGRFQPTAAPDSPHHSTSDELDSLKFGDVAVTRKSATAVGIRATARYKPNKEGTHETDGNGYTETALLPVFDILDLAEVEADLIEHFLPVAVDEAGGFAGFRDTATKTNSLIDRLRALTLPAVDDVRDGLESYIETKAHAEALEEQIERTDDQIDEIVYELYDLTDEEIQIVEETVGE